MISESNAVPADYFLSIDELCQKVSAKASWIYEQVHAEKFPHPIQMGGLSRWSGLEVDTWMAALRLQPRRLRVRASIDNARRAKQQKREAVSA